MASQRYRVTVGKDLLEAVGRFRLVLVHESACFGGVVTASAEVSAHFTLLKADEFLEYQADATTAERRRLLVHGLEGANDGAKLGRLRGKVMECLDLGYDICLVSAISPESFAAAAPGSSMIADAHLHPLPLCDPTPADRIGTTVMPAARRRCDVSELFLRVLRQVSVEALMDLDRAIYELRCGADTLAAELSEASRAELRRAGLLTGPGADGAEFSVPKRFQAFSTMLAEALGERVIAPTWFGTLTAELFTIEREIRLAIRRRAIAERGATWRKGLIGDALVMAVVERAKSDSQPLATSISDLRDPLEWLTLGELVVLARSKRFAGLGLPESRWQRFQHEMLPIRNRVSHMRLTSDSDLRTARSWRAQLPTLLASSAD